VIRPPPARRVERTRSQGRLRAVCRSRAVLCAAICSPLHSPATRLA
jgi:hypothetical protein